MFGPAYRSRRKNLSTERFSFPRTPLFPKIFRPAFALRLLSVVAFAFAVSAAPAGEPGVSLERSATSGETDRPRLARTIYVHNFENYRDPDTGRLLPESADYDGNGWPDFWEPILAVGYPEYLINTISIVPDPSGMIPGAYRDVPNHVLKMGFDGTRVGVRTKTPVPIDPSLSYEFSLLLKDDGLEGARIRAGVDWMRIDPSAVAVLRSDEIPDLPTGQTDWPVTPFQMLITDPPDTANAARLFVIIDRRSDAIGGGYHGEIRLDNISLKPHPKIIIAAPRPSPDGGQIIPVRYAGLIDNIPDPDNPGFFKGRRYFRRVEITDVYNQPVGAASRDRVPVEADDTGQATEEMTFPRDKYGVYYFNIRLYDAEERLTTDVMRAVAVMRPAETRNQMTLRSGKPGFGVSAGSVPDEILAMPGALRNILVRSGTRNAKLVPWPNEYASLGTGEPYYASLAEEIRGLRSAGIGVTGVIDPPSGMFGNANLAQVVNEEPDRLNRLIGEAGRRLGLYMDGWQWGGDSDGSLYDVSTVRSFDELLQTLGEFSGGLPMVENLRLQPVQPPGRFPAKPTIVQAYLPENEPNRNMWDYSAQVFPWLFEPYFNERGRIYPPARLARLAPAPAADQIEEQARSSLRTNAWLSLESAPAYPHEPNAAAEKVQLEQMLRRAVYAAVVAPEIIYLGDLFDPVKGMLRREAAGDFTLETMARPSYLAAATLTRCLEGAEYLGELGLLPPFEAHVFRRPGADEAIIALWHNDSAELLPLQRAEIANGPPLQLVDWAGNIQPLPPSIPVRRTPSFITGMPATLALTRMSVRINPEPGLYAVNRSQGQSIEIVNHMPRQAPILMRLRYAARQADGGMENGWTVVPEELRINLPPVTPTLTAGLLRFSASPDPNSQIQTASPSGVDKRGGKLAQVAMTVNSTPPADMLLYLPFRLRSDLDVDVEQLERPDDPHFVTLQLKVRWFPPDAGRRRGEIHLVPFYMKRGQNRETAPFPVAVKATPMEERGNPNTMFESVELRIPRNPQTQTWVGLLEESGSAFYLIDVTDYMIAP